ncbi:MAG: polyphosphate kinase 1, partial [Burkholderiales bacterium]
IRVRSVIGRFLEHTRIFHVRNGSEPHVYLSSADWMDRNFFRRIELAFPVLDPALKQRVIKEGLLAYLEDTPQTWLKNSEGEYERPAPKRGRVRMTQEELLDALAPAG